MTTELQGASPEGATPASQEGPRKLEPGGLSSRFEPPGSFSRKGPEPWVWTRTRRHELRKLRSSNVSAKEIAREFDLSVYAVESAITKFGLNIPLFWNTKREKELIALWSTGLSAREISRIIGTTSNAVIGKVHRMGLPKRPAGFQNKRTRTKLSTINAGQEPRGCRYIFGHPPDPDWRYCQKDGDPWCPEHLAIVFQKPANVGEKFRLSNLGLNVK